MKNTIKIIMLLCLTLVSLQSFSKDRKSQTLPTGQFIGGSEDNPSVVLVIHPNQTYEFKNTDTNIETTGRWEQKGNAVVLLHDKDLKFHDTWRFAKGDSCVKARHGAAFYRLCPK